MTNKIHQSVSDYLEQELRTFITDDYAYASYHAPNTMYQVNNTIDEILLTVSPSSLRTWHRTMTLLKRNADPVLACTVFMKYKYFQDLMSRSSFFNSIKELTDKNLIIKTNTNPVYIVNINYASKLYKPKLDM